MTCTVLFLHHIKSDQKENVSAMENGEIAESSVIPKSKSHILLVPTAY
jgi:hypothetical protein